MSDHVADLTSEIRAVKPLERGKGHSVPSTGDVAQQPAVARQTDVQGLGGRQLDFARQGQGGPARRDAANHFGFKVQDGLEIKSFVETIAVRAVAAEAVLTIDPKVATQWRIVAGGSFSIAVSDLPEGTVGGQDASRVVSLILYIQRPPGAEITWPAGTMFGLDILDPDGDGDRSDSLLAPPTAARMDVFVLNKIPSVGWIGFIAALGLSAV